MHGLCKTHVHAASHTAMRPFPRSPPTLPDPIASPRLAAEGHSATVDTNIAPNIR